MYLRFLTSNRFRQSVLELRKLISAPPPTATPLRLDSRLKLPGVALEWFKVKIVRTNSLKSVPLSNSSQFYTEAFMTAELICDLKFHTYGRNQGLGFTQVVS